MPFEDESFSSSGLMPFEDESFSSSGFSPFQETATETMFPSESMKDAVIVEAGTIFEKPPYVSQADWDNFPPDMQKTVSEEWLNSSPAEQERLALFSPGDWGTIKGI
ncbi:MAG: hypothetical protein ACO3YZ_04745 [Candidatus Nanopelagicaceae bacterium]